MNVRYMRRGDSKEFAITLVTEDGAPLPLDGVVVRVGGKLRSWDSDEDAVFIKTEGNGVTIDDAPGGLCTLRLEPEDTEGLTDCPNVQCDVQLVSADDVKTPLVFLLSILPDITIGHGS